MEKIKLFLYLTDVEYGKRLLRFLSGRKNAGFVPELVTSDEGISGAPGGAMREAVILTDEKNERRAVSLAERGQGRVICLSEEPGRRKGKIFQYQKAEGIYRELLEQMGLTEEAGEACGGEDTEERGVYFVFAPGVSGGTLLAVLLAQYLGKQGQCLYLSLAALPLYYGEELSGNPDFDRKGTGELLFFVEQADFAEKERSLRQDFGTAHMLAPISHYRDLLDCPPEDWKRFFERLRGECGYDSIVVEMNQFYEFTPDILEMGTRTLALWESGLCGRIQRAVFAHYCQIEKREAAKGLEEVELPPEYPGWVREWTMQPLAELSENPQKMAFVRELLRRKKEGGEEDVYIIEDVR